MTRLVAASAESCREAGALLRSGALVAFPTETVYGLGGHACDDRAVAGIFAAKGRPSFNPLIVHVASIAAAEALVVVSDVARQLMARFWPGPLTLVLPRRDACGLSDLVSAGLPSVAIRMPGHPVAQAILQAAGCPVAAPSANLSGRISPTQADHVLAGLDGRIAMIVDGGACRVGLESTVLDLTGDTPRILRPGSVTADEISAGLGTSVALSPEDAVGKPLLAPGQLSSHYAPDAGVRLNAHNALAGEALLGFGPIPDATLNLSPSGDLIEAAANLFTMLRTLDNGAYRAIAVSPIPEQGLGAAINDRLRRAAAPR